MRGIDYTNTFLVKVWLTMNPVKGLFFGVFTFICINSYLLLLQERGDTIMQIHCYDVELKDRIRTYRDAIWTLIVTFLTVGYGDHFPISNAGRYIAILTTIGG